MSTILDTVTAMIAAGRARITTDNIVSRKVGSDGWCRWNPLGHDRELLVRSCRQTDPGAAPVSCGPALNLVGLAPRASLAWVQVCESDGESISRTTGAIVYLPVDAARAVELLTLHGAYRQAGG